MTASLFEQPEITLSVPFSFTVSPCEVSSVVTKDTLIDVDYIMDSGYLSFATSEYVQTPACNLKPILLSAVALN